MPACSAKDSLEWRRGEQRVKDGIEREREIITLWRADGDIAENTEERLTLR